MTDDEFTIMIKEDKYEFAIKLKDSHLIGIYHQNPDQAVKIFRGYVNEAVGDLIAPDEIKSEVGLINIQRMFQKLDLARRLKENRNNLEDFE